MVSRFVVSCACFALGLSAAACMAQQTVPVAPTFYNFTGGSQGSTPSSPLIQATDGNFYGGTSDGGNESNGQYCGTIFSLGQGAAYKLIHAFSCTDGSVPNFLMQALDGNLYGTTRYGGASSDGTVFQLTLSGQFTTLHTFTGTADGSEPNFLVPGADGNLYGTAYSGGNGGGGGTVFKLTTGGQLTVLGAFSLFEGAPYGLVQAVDGNFYGAISGGGYSSGIFKTPPTGPLSIIETFPSGESEGVPEGQFAEGTDGSLYGTVSGGDSGKGGIVKVSPGGTTSFFYDFTNTDFGYSASGLFGGSDGNFYGVTPGSEYAPAGSQGTVYSISPSAVLTAVATLGGTLAALDQRLLQASDGNFYGVASFDGYATYGGVYRVSSGLAAPVAISVSPSQIAAGGSATLTWSVANATSETFKECFAAGAWSGVQASSGSMTVKPGAIGNYNYALSCGGTESGAARLAVAGTQASSSTTLVATSPKVAPGGTATLVVDVNSTSGSGPTPAGSVTLLNHGTALLTSTLSGGAASFLVNETEVPVGSASFTAQYGGDAYYTASTSSPVPVVFQALPTLTITAPVYVTQGQPIPFTVKVAGPASGAAPSGTVTISGDYSTTLTLTNGTASGTIPGSVTENREFYITLKATYSGDSTYLSATVTQDIEVLLHSVVALSSSSTQLSAGQSLTLVAQIMGPSDSTPTGSVNFDLGSFVLGSAAVSSNVAIFTLSTAGVPPGTYALTAAYLGDANNGIGTSPPLNVTIKDGTTTKLMVAPNPVETGQTVTMTATVARASATGNAGGSVTFSTGGITLATVNLTSGTAVYKVALSGVPTGTYPLVATYNGDSSDATSVSPVVSLTVQ